MQSIKLFLTSVLIGIIPCCSFQTISQTLTNTKDSTCNLVVAVKIQVANAGFAPVPAFSFNDPLAIGFITLKKNHFSFDSDFALGFNGKPWMMNNWFRLEVIRANKFTLQAGVNPSLFFKQETNDKGEQFILTQRNFSFELVGTYAISEKWILRSSFVRNTACDIGALSGNFFDVSVQVSPIRLSETFYMITRGQLFYFDFGEYQGVFTSTTWHLHHYRIPVSIFFQGVLPLWASFPGNRFKWNTGIAYSF